MHTFFRICFEHTSTRISNKDKSRNKMKFDIFADE